jgi:hypothetical protein
MSGLTLAGLAALALAGCGSGAIALSTPTATATTAIYSNPPTATPWPTSSVTLVSDTQITCPVTVSGNQKVFLDADTGLKFSFPATLTEEHCQRIVGSDGSVTTFVGNLFIAWTRPRTAGQTIQQWVNTQTDQYETVTLSPLTVAHAESAVSVNTEPTATPGPRGFDAEPFAGTIAIVAGTQRFYGVSGLVAMMNATDSTPGANSTINAIIATFDVP